MWKRDKEPSKTTFFTSEVKETEKTKRNFEEKIARIGQSIIVTGELSGNEDLFIEGKVEGKINLKNNALIIGPDGKVTAEIQAKKVTINGNVSGNVHATEIVIINKTGSLTGDIFSPRILIADGAHFKGSVKMEKKIEQISPFKEKFEKKEEEKEEIKEEVKSEKGI
ncbi:MAG: polymer-forming cytoskeletal protein [Candidatus Aminicenantia bacterium]